MKSPTIKFLVWVFMLTAICAVLQQVWNTQMPEKRLYDGFWLLGIFAASVVVVHLVLLKATQAPGSSFVRVFMVSTTLKFFFYLSLLVGFVLYSKDNKEALVLHFLFYYLVFNALEISMLYQMGKK